jgi:DNA-binding transcriptional LysR family regulator
MKASLHLPSLLAFEAASKALNFARAAAQMGVTPTAMSKTIKQLEERLGTRLFNRTTRSVALTQAGAELFASLSPALAQVRTCVEEAGSAARGPSGLLRINTSYVAYATLIEGHVADFLAHHADVTVDIQIDNALTDIVGHGFDAGIRLGEALQKDMVAVPLGPAQQMVVVGSPEYFSKRGRPKAPRDLLEHECILQRMTRGAVAWEFAIDGKTIAIETRGRLVLNDMQTVMAAAVRNCGLAYVFRGFAAGEIKAGRLEVVLQRYCPSEPGFFIYYPSRLQVPGKLRAFVDFIAARNKARKAG